MQASTKTPIRILGIGNLLWADEGFGVRVVEHLQARYRFPVGVECLDGGTQGLNLLGAVQGSERLAIVDAVDFGDPPGTLRVIRGSDVPCYLGAKKMSLHQTGFQEVLATAELLGDLPKDLLLVGLQPQILEDYGGGLTQVVSDCIEPAAAEVVAWLHQQGIAPEGPLKHAESGLGEPAVALDRANYEGKRPSPEQACRIGDPRFLRPRTRRGWPTTVEER